jgi:hypothetical protein
MVCKNKKDNKKDEKTNKRQNRMIPPITRSTSKLVLKSDIDEKVLFSKSKLRHITNTILDTGSTKHVIVDRSLFQSFRNCNKAVLWGKIKTVFVKGIGDALVTFSDTNKKYLLKNCLYMPELGINLIS